MREKWTEATLQIEGSSFHYVRTGDGSKPPLVLLHGFSDNGLCWQPIAEELEGRYDILLPDARGHGLSARVERGQVIDAAADLDRLLEILGIQNAIVGGHSMGAAVAARLAARFPTRVRALLLEDPPWRMPEPKEDEAGFWDENNPLRQWVADLQQKTTSEVFAQCKRENPAWPDIYIQRWGEGKQQLDLNFFVTQGAGWDQWIETVQAIHCPTLVITADPELGGIIDVETAGKIAAMNPQIRIAHIPGAGHHIRFAQPAAYSKVVGGFLNAIG